MDIINIQEYENRLRIECDEAGNIAHAYCSVWSEELKESVETEMRIFRKPLVRGASYWLACEVDTYILQQDSKGRWRIAWSMEASGTTCRFNLATQVENDQRFFVSISDRESIILSRDDTFEITRMVK